MYGVVTGHVAFDGVRLAGSEGKAQEWTETEGKALCAVVLAVCGAAKVYKLHWVKKEVKDKKE